jgi:Homeodomain-like domain
MGHAIEIKLTDAQRQELRGIVRRPSEAAGVVRRARVVLLSDEGVAGREIARRLDLSPEAVSVIRARFRAGGVAGLAEQRDRSATPGCGANTTCLEGGARAEINRGSS